MFSKRISRGSQKAHSEPDKEELSGHLEKPLSLIAHLSQYLDWPGDMPSSQMLTRVVLNLTGGASSPVEPKQPC